MRLCVRSLSTLFFSASIFLLAPRVIAQQSPQTSPAVRSFVNEVLVPAVVRDAHGNVVGNLTSDDFQIFDDGKLQTITGFNVIKRPSESAAAAPDSSAPAPNASDPSAVSQPASPPPRFVVIVFDVYDLTVTDFAPAQRAAIKALDSSLAPSDMAAVLSTSGTNSGLTRDRAKLKQTILDLKLKPFFHPGDEPCPRVDYYEADLILNKNDGPALQAAVVEAEHCFYGITLDAAEDVAQTAARRAMELGRHNYENNLNFLRVVLTGVAKLPGPGVVILVSPGFFAPDPEALTLTSEILDLAARTNTVINTLDARGLYTTNLGADTSVRIDQDTDQDSQRVMDRYRRESMAANADILGQLADGTGGTFYHNNNDLESGFKTLISAPEYTYLLAFSPANPKPKAHHTLKVKVRAPGLTVQARRAYSSPSPEKQK